MQFLIQATPGQIARVETLVGKKITSISMSDSSYVANHNFSPVALEQIQDELAQQTGRPTTSMTPWTDLDAKAQYKIALLMADSTP